MSCKKSWTLSRSNNKSIGRYLMKHDFVCANQVQIQKFRNWYWLEIKFSSVNLLWTCWSWRGYLWIRTLVPAINASWELTVTRVIPRGVIRSSESAQQCKFDTRTEPGVELEPFSVTVSNSDTVISRKYTYTIRGIFIRIITRCLCKSHTNWQMIPISILWRDPQLQPKHS